jgi:hypothetical protein
MMVAKSTDQFHHQPADLSNAGDVIQASQQPANSLSGPTQKGHEVIAPVKAPNP